MPLIQVDLDHDHYASIKDRLSQALQEAQVDVYDVPGDDLFQVFRSHAAGEVRAGEDAAGHPIVIRITGVHRYPLATKQALFAAITARVSALGVSPADIHIILTENAYEDWYAGK
ncbi:tautomerase family protein [Gryllotalpicola protaetiae]|uniref:Tautomerase family protein n=1 Tax=Gryllotalpicola protaetiae TaxID=2419771 RepID=A0A387BJ64_9MICO|nr:tautomerase family protein [Gryllotalpicola protaetiae]AYG04135.1 hypothetical protein D7I44_11735 [Gryllotalpicola protaetiae]